MSTYEPCVLGSDGNCTRWSHDHAADRPPVTDDARAVREAAMDLYRALRRTNPDALAEVDEVEDWAYWDDIVRTAQVTLAAGRAEAWAEGHRTGWEHCQDGNYGNDYWDDPTPNPYAAAARAETTTAHECDSGGFDRTICDCGAMHSYCTICGTRQDDCPHGTTTEEWPRCKASRDGGCDRCHDEHGRHIHCRAETTTATTEDTARAIHRALAPRWMSVAQALGPGQDAYEAMLADIAKALADAGLLATARTRPTHDDISDAIEHSGIAIGTSDAEQAADAVLALLRGGA